MKRFFFLLFVAMTLLAPLKSVQAGERWRDLQPEDRQEMRRQMREHWREQSARDYPQREAREPRPGWRDVPPEERRRLREEMREMHERRDYRR